MDKDKSIILVDIDDNQFVIETDKISKEEKMHISIIANNLSSFIAKAYELSPFDKIEAFKAVLREDLGINPKSIGIDLEIGIRSSNETRDLSRKNNRSFER